MITTAATTPHPDVVGTTLDNGETVLMQMATANYFTLNCTGTHIWALLGQGLTPTAIVEQLVAKYDVSADQATVSVCELVEELTAQQLLTVVKE